MANQQHLDLLKQSVKTQSMKTWNQWKEQLTDVQLDLSEANLNYANLREATLVRTNFAEATLTHCHIYGIAAWGVELKGARQNNLIISRWDEPTITVDNLEVAQFIYLLLNNTEIRDVIDTITSKVVLILGHFMPERKAILDTLEMNFVSMTICLLCSISRDLLTEILQKQ